MNPVEPSRGCELISTYTAEKLQDSKEIKIKFKHQERWRNALKFYKISVANKDTKKLCVKSEDEPGIKQSAWNSEYFDKLLDSIKTELIELVSSKNTLCKRSGVEISFCVKY